MLEISRRAMSYFLILFAAHVAEGQTMPKADQAGRQAPSIPGITAKDPFPRGCVDCHLNYAGQKMDLRFSTLLKQWTEKVDPQLLKKVSPSAPAGLTLKGKHPSSTAALKNIPASCLPCHGQNSKMAPPFARMIHAIHLTGGKDNRFLTSFGECTSCHKLDATTGAFSMPSGPEK